MVAIGWGVSRIRHPGSATAAPSRTGGLPTEPITPVELTTESRAALRTANKLVDDPSTDNWHTEALAYASSRWLDTDTVRRFHLGFARGRLKR